MTSTPDPYDEADLTAVLRERRVHPDDIGALLGYVPVALTQMCWRNSVVEDWHAGPDSRISDAAMMRANVSTTRIFSQNLRHAIGDRWAEFGAFDHRTIDTDKTSSTMRSSVPSTRLSARSACFPMERRSKSWMVESSMSCMIMHVAVSEASWTKRRAMVHTQC